MAELSHPHPARTPSFFARIDKAWLVVAAILILLAVFDRAQLMPSILSTFGSISHTGIFILFAIFTMATLKASGAETIVARAFEGRQSRMILLASLLGGLAPFCSCEVIPFIAALLAMGTPLSVVMAFWLSSPIMDPPMFLITSSALGVDFAIAKTLAAVGMGLFGGFGVMALGRTTWFADPLRNDGPAKSCCSSSSGCGDNLLESKPKWAFWQDQNRRSIFRRTLVENGLFLFKWLTIAYLFESLMIAYVPADLIASLLGGEGMRPILMGALLGAPAYLNGYAAVPLISGLLEQGMAQGAAMSFSLAGGVFCIPSAIAVWALVRPRIFAAYVGFAFVGSMIAGIAWALVA